MGIIFKPEENLSNNSLVEAGGKLKKNFPLNIGPKKIPKAGQLWNNPRNKFAGRTTLGPRKTFWGTTP